MSNFSIKEMAQKEHTALAASEIAKKNLSLNDIQMDGDTVYWSEGRPGPQSQTFIVSYHEKRGIKDETSQSYNVSTGVHGYGGGAFLVRDNIIYFYDALTCQVYKKNTSCDTCTQLTLTLGLSYADFSISKSHDYLYALCLDSTQNLQFPVTTIVRIHIPSKTQEILFKGADFYSNIRIDENGSRLLFLQWNYPNMPWDENELWVADIKENGEISNPKKHYHQKKGVFVPTAVGATGEIYAAVDLDGYWKISKILENKVIPICSYEADFGRPLWTAATNTYAFVSNHKMIAHCARHGIWETVLIDLEKNTHEIIENNLTYFANMAANYHGVAMLGGSDKLPISVVYTPLSDLKKMHVLSPKNNFLPKNISLPQKIEFTSQGKKVFAFYYAPCEEHGTKKPPCILKIHGGPTSSADCLFNAKIQYYTQRGFAYVEINYSGSSGYGKEYRNRLNGKWGVVDVEDCIACAQYLIDTNLACGHKLFLAGSSAGGFTLLNTLTKTSLFKGAACHYGIGDLAQMAQHIHKFEACYDQNLIGDTLENNPKLYQERSPIFFAHKITTPVIFFHGKKDPVVNYEQSVKMSEALQKNNVECEIYLFENEGHGFKREDTIVCVFEKELAFFNALCGSQT